MANNGKTILAAILMAACCVSALGREPGFAEYRAMQESLSRVHPRMRAGWLCERGLDDSPYATFRKPDSGSGLRCIGRWPWGPSWELCGRDSLLFLGSGSGVRILSISDSAHPRQLGQIAARGLVSQLVVRDTLLFVACGNWGAHIYSVSDPANPQELGSVDAVALDVCVRDTLCFTVGGDSLRIYNVANPHLPVQLSAARDSGELVVVSGTHVYAAWDGMNVYDVSNPLSPSRVNTRGGQYLTLFLRDTLLFCSSIQPSYFAILNISDPLNIQQIGYISGHGGIGLYADDYFAYLSCSYDFEGIFVIDITNPSNPQLRGGYNPEGSSNYDPYVPSPLSFGYVASEFGGLVVLDLHNPNTPAFASSDFQAHEAVNVSVNGSLAYVSEFEAGLRVLDVSDPTQPTTLGIYDTIAVLDVKSAVARDSFAFITYWGDRRRFLRVLDVSNPAAPVFAAEESCRNPPEDIVLRDSFLYCAEVNQFQIFNVARPRQPVLVGSCVIGDMNSCGLALSDSFACVAGTLAGLQVINVARPSSPFLVSSNPDSRASAWGVAVRDTLVFVPSFYETLWVFSSANPESLRLLGGCSMGSGFHGYDVALSDDSLAFVATSQGIVLMDVSDPAAPRRLGACTTPYDARRVYYERPYVYAACYNAGVCVLETTAVAVAEERPDGETRAAVGMRGSVVRDELVIELPAPDGGDVMLSAYDIGGRCVETSVLRGQGQEVRYSFVRLPAGVYVVRVRCSGQTQSFKVVKL